MSKCLQSSNNSLTPALHCMILRGYVNASQLLRTGLFSKFVKTHSISKRLFLACSERSDDLSGRVGSLRRAVNITLNPLCFEKSNFKTKYSRANSLKFGEI